MHDHHSLVLVVNNCQCFIRHFDRLIGFILFFTEYEVSVIDDLFVRQVSVYIDGWSQLECK